LYNTGDQPTAAIPAAEDDFFRVYWSGTGIWTEWSKGKQSDNGMLSVPGAPVLRISWEFEPVSLSQAAVQNPKCCRLLCNSGKSMKGKAQSILVF